MSRSGYDLYNDDDGAQWAAIRYAGALNSAIKGKRGQAFLAELLVSLDAMPVKELIAAELVEDGCVCALGAVGVARGIDLSELDPEDYLRITEVFKIPSTLVREIEFQNDDGGSNNETPAKRWFRMREWVVRHLKSI